MPSRTTARTPDVFRDKLFWAFAWAMVIGQLAAFWMLCSHQVRKAEMREASAQVERMAVADCLRYIPGATLSSCAMNIAPLDRGPAPVALAHQSLLVNTAARGGSSNPVPVNYVYR